MRIGTGDVTGHLQSRPHGMSISRYAEPTSSQVAAPWDTPLTPTSLYFPTLDGLRFVAFALVFFHHIPVPTSLFLGALRRDGWVGVSIFLTLSAYLLTAILTAEYEQAGRLSVSRFYIRRSLRIWPLYYAFVAATALYAWQSPPAHYEVRVAGLLTFTDNILSGLLHSLNQIPFTGHLWTVGLEEQFYLLLPLLLRSWLPDRKKACRNIVAIWVTFVIVRIVAVSLHAPYPMLWTSVFSADAILIGILLALSPPIELTGRRRFALMGVALLGLASPAFMPMIGIVGWHQVIVFTTVALGSGALCLCALHEPWLAWFSSKPLRYVGKISYGLYVFHLLGVHLALSIVTWLVGHNVPVVSEWIATSASAFLITLALSAASYRFLESPFLRLKRRFESIRTRAV
jgi:peptidoglycan/LPS O-acetylase OafA/YrhL